MDGIDILTVDKVRTAVMPWKEKIKVGETIQTATGKHYLVKQVLLVNKEIVILECKEYTDRVDNQALSAGGLAYRRVEDTKVYVTANKFEKKFISVEQSGVLHLLPDRIKRCH